MTTFYTEIRTLSAEIGTFRTEIGSFYIKIGSFYTVFRSKSRAKLLKIKESGQSHLEKRYFISVRATISGFQTAQVI